MRYQPPLSSATETHRASVHSLSTITADDDAPYLPPASASGPTPRLPSYLNPADLTPEAPDTYIFPHEMCVGDDVFDSPSSSNAHPGGRAIPATTPSARRRRTPARKYRDADSDEEEEEAEEDVYAESSADDASEDEYMPSPRVQKRKLSSATSARKATTSAGGRKSTRAAPRHSYSPYPSSGLSSAPSPAASSSASSSSCAGRRAGSRNIQVFDSPPPPRGAWDKDGPRAYRCPYCAHVQANKRSPDMERHIRSHFRAAGGAGQQWVCCGVPVERADAYGVAAANGGGEWEFNGVRMVGGCHEDFSRMDALKRHWKNANNACVGDVQYARAT